MLVDGEKALAAFQKVQQVQEEYETYVLAPDKNYLSIEDLHVVTEQMYDLKIQKFGVAFSGSFTRGMMLRYNDRAVIYVRRGLSDELTRFTVVKELCQIILDEEEDWTTDGVQIIEDLQLDVLLSDDAAPKTTQSEVLAEVAAIELMYPYDCRQTDMEKISAGDTSETKIAIDHGVPDWVVTRALGSSHQKLATQMWSQIRASLAAE